MSFVFIFIAFICIQFDGVLFLSLQTEDTTRPFTKSVESTKAPTETEHGAGNYQYNPELGPSTVPGLRPLAPRGSTEGTERGCHQTDR